VQLKQFWKTQTELSNTTIYTPGMLDQVENSQSEWKRKRMGNKFLFEQQFVQRRICLEFLL